MRRKSRKLRRSIVKGIQPRRGFRAAESEPRLEGEEWVEWGGQRIWAVGFTAGGAPYGLTEEEMREASFLPFDPASLVPNDQLWFHNPETQARVARAEADFAEGRSTRTDSPEEAQSFLDRLKKGS